MVDRVIFDVELVDPQFPREPRRAHERSESGIEPGLRLLHRQQLAVAPERAWPRLDQASAEGAAHRRVVVRHLERPKTLGTHPERFGRIQGSAEMARQPGHEFHTVLPCAAASAPAATSVDWCTPSVRTVTGQPARSYVDFKS